MIKLFMAIHNEVFKENKENLLHWILVFMVLAVTPPVKVIPNFSYLVSQ